MTQIDYLVEKNERLEMHNQLLKEYALDIENFKQSIENQRMKFSFLDENKKSDYESRLKHASVVFNYLNAYMEIINKVDFSASTVELSRNIQSIKMVLPVIKLSKTLLEAHDAETIQLASSSLLTHALEHLKPHPTWNDRVTGALSIFFGLLVITASLTLAAFLCLVICGGNIGIVSTLCACIQIMLPTALFVGFGAVMCYVGYDIFMDKNNNRDALYSKVADFNGAFFNVQDAKSCQHPNEVPLLTKEASAPMAIAVAIPLNP